MELARDVAAKCFEVAQVARKEHYDRKAVERSFECGNLVWVHLPGMDAKLEEAWLGPFEVQQLKNRVNYKVRLVDGSGHGRIVHVKILKKCVERQEAVRRLMVVEESGEAEFGSGVKLKERFIGYAAADIAEIKAEFEDVLQDIPGNTKSAVISINIGDALSTSTHKGCQRNLGKGCRRKFRIC